MSQRVYLDWNATAPLRPEARAAMLAALDLVGNPSSVHAEGRAAAAVVERARQAVARLVGCAPEMVVFTSGATEANNMALRAERLRYAPTEHASVIEAAPAQAGEARALGLLADGRVDPSSLADAAPGTVVAVAAANGETGLIEDVAALFAAAPGVSGHCDATQAAGRTGFDFAASGAVTAAISAHKIGGPKGIGALVVGEGRSADYMKGGAMLRGGGQERGWRAGTENIACIAGFGAAAEAALRDLDSAVWNAVALRRDRLETRIVEAAPDALVIGAGNARLPNTSCIAVPGWAGETQVMQLDMAGFAVSAGAACSSGKVRRSHVLAAMGLDAVTAGSAVRVSLGPTTTDDDIDRFCAAWTGLYNKRRARAA